MTEESRRHFWPALQDSRSRWRWLALAAIGALTSFAFAPYDVWSLTFFGPAVLLWWSAGRAPRPAFASGWWWGLGFFGAGVPWVYNSIHEFGHVVAPAAALITVGFAVVLALFTGASLALAAICTRQRLPFILIAAPSAWVLMEWLRSWILTGFPWLSLGYAHTDSPLASVAPLLGVFGVSLAVMIVAAALAALPLLGMRGRVGAVLGIAVVIPGAWALSMVTWTQGSGEHRQVAVLQGNFAQAIKWEPEWLAPQMRWYHEQSVANLDADIIVWPEAAIPASANRIIDSYLLPLSQRAAGQDAAIVLGIPWSDDEGRAYNTILGLGTSESHYRKIHLVPLGEYFPLKPLLQWIPGLEHSFFDMTPGSRDQPPFMVGNDEAGVSVCYEDAFGSLNRRSLPEAGYLLNVTNDAWFGPVAPHQHLQIARMRAIESERWMMRAANTGISAVADPKGRLVSSSALNEEAVLRTRIEVRSGATPYVVVGDGLVAGLSGLILALLVGFERRRAAG